MTAVTLGVRIPAIGNFVDTRIGGPMRLSVTFPAKATVAAAAVALVLAGCGATSRDGDTASEGDGTLTGVRVIYALKPAEGRSENGFVVRGKKKARVAA